MTVAYDHNLDRSVHLGAPNCALATDTILQDRYRIVRQLGRGGMGAVYEAVDQRLGKTVALKETLSTEPSMRKQFEREARLLAGMQHPALPQVSDHFVEGSRAFLVMQFIGGTDLAKIISQQPGPFPPDQVIAWADQLLDALIYLHSRDRQVIHRDIKPHNLKLTATGQIALLDFGLAKAQASDPSVTASQAFFGYTRHYAPLEQIQDQRTDPRSDIYALGATLYHLLTGIKPPDAMVRATAVVNAGADPLLLADQIHAAVGPEIAAILNKAMAQKPGDRYANASEFREALRRMGRTKAVALKKESELADAAALAANRTIHISDLPSVRANKFPTPNLALVASARRFGPAGATAVLLVIFMLAAGILYGSQSWWSAEKLTQAAPAAATDTASALRQLTRKPDRPRVGEAPVTLKSKSTAEGAERTADKPSGVSAGNSQVEKRPPVLVKAPVVSGRGAERASSATRKNSQRLGAPSIRLPNPEFRDNAPVPSPDARVRSYRSANVPPPQFFRAADGTQIVKFSDGTTRFVHPEQR
ncbi:MAG TPA: serine/threonine-protein kinase [Pyrinomonadaceae bacterium]|nr:serine/threonine-protein kinase [Pyrinomonadaceae bacterium]